MRPIIIVFALQIAALVTAGLATYETRYTDSSGARCVTFTLGNREADLCSGAIDRDAPYPVAFPADWQPNAPH